MREGSDEAMDVIVAGGGPVGLMTAALLDVTGVRVEVYKRGSEPTRQSRGTAMHPRTLEVLIMLGTGLLGGVPDQVGWVGDMQPAGPVEHARHHWHKELGHANVVPPGGSVARVCGTHAGDSQLAAGQARRQEEPFTLPGLSATLTGISGTSFGARSPSRLARTCNTGRRDAASLAWNGLPQASAARTHMQRTASRSSRP